MVRDRIFAVDQTGIEPILLCVKYSVHTSYTTGPQWSTNVYNNIKTPSEEEVSMLTHRLANSVVAHCTDSTIPDL